jgi:hypothetical protein
MYSGDVKLTKLRQNLNYYKSSCLYLCQARSMFENIRWRENFMHVYTRRIKLRWSCPFSVSGFHTDHQKKRTKRSALVRPEHLLKWMLQVIWWFIQAIVSTGEINLSESECNGCGHVGRSSVAKIAHRSMIHITTDTTVLQHFTIQRASNSSKLHGGDSFQPNKYTKGLFSSQNFSRFSVTSNL